MIEQLYLNGQEVIQIYLNKNRILKKQAKENLELAFLCSNERRNYQWINTETQRHHPLFTFA